MTHGLHLQILARKCYSAASDRYRLKLYSRLIYVTKDGTPQLVPFSRQVDWWGLPPSIVVQSRSLPITLLSLHELPDNYDDEEAINSEIDEIFEKIERHASWPFKSAPFVVQSVTNATVAAASEEGIPVPKTSKPEPTGRQHIP